ncbi:MAG TPA: zinc ABC transporter substrate-binding protein [Acidimicrobiia bacterium]|nr:zinc ABC transporter substrate-binding protein [Acidimicrobiia bacterium]
MHRCRIATFIVLLGAVGAGCGSSPGRPGAAGVVRVVAAENFWGDIAHQIGGSHVEVTSVISDPTADPHQYESDARDAAALADARIVIVNGSGYDDFMGKLLSNTASSTRVVLNVSGVLHAPKDANPHLWYDLPRVREVASAMESALAAAAPADRSSFAANLATFDRSLAPLQRLLTKIKSKYPGAPVAYTERVPGYLLDAAGLKVASPRGFAQAIEDGNEPSAGDAQSMDDLVRGHRVRALLYNAQATSPATQHVQDLAHGAGVPVVPVTETLPKNEPSYQAWQQHQLQALLAALGG